VAVTETTDRFGDDPTTAQGPGDPAGHRSGGASLGQLTGRWRTVAGIIVVAVVVAAVVLRFWTRSALWLDEALTVDIARQPVRELQHFLRRDGAPPLYYFLLHFWMGIFGQSDLAVRSLAGVLSVATLPIAWVAGRRFGGRTVAWATLLLLASSPFAIYYATESRMYALVMFLTACGFLALERALRAPRPGNLTALALVVGALLYTQYWALYLVAVAGLWLLYQSWRGRVAWRRPARFAFGATFVGSLTFLPWLPTFLFQAHHTGTPWAAPANMAAVINAITGFTDNQGTLTDAGSNQGRLLALLYFVLIFLALFGIAKDRWHTELDLRTRPRARGMTWIVVGTLVLAVLGGIVSKSAFSQRYASVVLVPLVLLMALGVATLASPKVRAVVLAVAVAAGLAVGVENIWTQRTQAPAVAAVIRAHAAPGDVVAFCPDQLGPATARLLPTSRYRLLTFPRGTGPQYVNWINYLDVVERANPVTFAQRLERMAGNHTIWAVWAPGYNGFGDMCNQLVTTLSQEPGVSTVQRVTLDPGEYYEPMYLWEFRKSS